MAFGWWLGVFLLLVAWSSTKCDEIPNGVLDMECRDRYLMIAADLSFTGEEPCFEAVDATGVHPITTLYAAECGYSISTISLPGHVELRASYFSCHADNKDDEVFTLNFNLISRHDEGNVTYALNKTCSPALPWSPREVTCEVNYMEVSVKSDMTCPSGTKQDDWNSALTAVRFDLSIERSGDVVIVKGHSSWAYSSATSDWQVMFQREGQQLMPMNISEARKLSYVFDLTDGRLVFRTPYGQPNSVTTMMDGEPVQVIHATLFSRHSWVVLMVDLVAACSMNDGSYDGSSLVWKTPEVLYPLVSGRSSLASREVNMGVNGELLEQTIAMERGYNMKKHDGTLQISIPYNAEGGYTESYVMDNLYHEVYVFHLYVEQIFVDENYVDTRLRLHRPLATPLVPRHVFTVNNTVLEERRFTVYIGDVPEDVELAAVALNGQDFSVPFTNMSSYTISKVLQPNRTHGYTLSVPFEDPIVQRWAKEGVLQLILDINYTLTLLPEKEPYYHLASIEALMDASPPAFEAVCSEKGITFKLDYRPFDYLWVVYVGSDMLTAELAAQKGYILHNDSQSLILDVPLYTDGYTYEDIGLKTFFGTFTLHIRDSKTLEVQGSSVKTCPFLTTGLILCSTDGKMTVVADVPMTIPSGMSASLLDKHCIPKEANDTSVLFSFGLNSCGSRVMIGPDTVTYVNEIVFSPKFATVKNPSPATEKVTLRCVYPLAGLHRLFTGLRFESDFPGVGSIVHDTVPVESSQQRILQPTFNPTTALQTTMSTTERPIKNLPALQSPVRYIRVFSFLRDLTRPSPKKGAQGSSHG